MSLWLNLLSLTEYILESPVFLRRIIKSSWLSFSPNLEVFLFESYFFSSSFIIVWYKEEYEKFLIITINFVFNIVLDYTSYGRRLCNFR